jgi:hypothetical protein
MLPIRRQPKPPPAEPHQITVLETVYHAAPGQQLTSVTTTWTLPIESDEQVYQRRVRLTSDWQPLDCGWVIDVALVLIKNDGVTPIRVGNAELTFVLRPGETFRAQPLGVMDRPSLCALDGGVAQVYVYPK